MRIVHWSCPECGQCGSGEIGPRESTNAGIFRICAEHIATSNCTENIEWSVDE
jgi:hypothetical protein